jgi:hypothetical protein
VADPISRINKISTAPSDDKAFDAWLRFDDAVAFLRDNARGDEVVFFASAGQHTYLNSLVVPANLVEPPDVEDLMAWDCNPASSWSIEVILSEPQSVSLSPPLSQTSSKTMKQGEQLVFSRHFHGRLGKKHYYEILQKFIHVFELHFLSERNAYCRLDKQGDIEDVIKIFELSAKGGEWGTNVVTFDRAVLDEYLVLTNSVIVCTFDFTRYRPSQFGDWSNLGDVQNTREDDLFYRSHIEAGHASYMRGCQIVRPVGTKEAIINRLDYSKEERQYASFIAFDFKNKVVREISTAPGETANYFTDSHLPFEMSPAFFKPEVLLKYKADSEKYRLSDRSITCRDTWSLETYDVNDAGQVHTYLAYLRRLPYREQLHWKACNERPRGSISKRAMTTDFEGDWHLEYDPLNSLKQIVRQLDHDQIPWWTLRAEDLPDRVHYPVTASADEWSNEILHLDQLLVEGFETKWFRNKAISLGRKPGPTFGSLLLVRECLIALGFDDGDAQQLIAPLKKTHDLRSKLKGHASGNEAVSIRKQILKDYGSYKNHFHSLCSACDEAIRAIRDRLLDLR